MQLRFVKSESTFTYFEATRVYLEKHGKPLALYSDKASVFRINNKNATGGDGYTQFGRAMQPMILPMNLWPITTGALRKRPGMTLMFTGHFKLMMIWLQFSHGESRAVFQNP